MSTSSDTNEDDRIVAKCYVELGYVTKEKGEYDESLRYHRQSLEIFERIDDALCVADSHLNIAEVYKAKGELKQAMCEYEKGLTLYEDVYVDDANKNSDSGTDLSLNSSYCDLQHTKSLSKSEEILPQVTRINILGKDTSIHSPRDPANVNIINTSIASLNLINFSLSKKLSELEGISHLTTSVDDSAMILSKNLTDKRLNSLSSSRTSDLEVFDDPDIFAPISSSDFTYETSDETKPEENDIIDICTPFLSSFEMTNQDQLSSNTNYLLSNTKSDKEINNNNFGSTRRISHYLPNKQFLIILFTVFLAYASCRLFYDSTRNKTIASSSSDSSVNIQSRIQNDRDDLNKQLRKLLLWRKTQILSLDKENRRAIEEFLITNSDGRTKMTVDKFQKILNMLDLKIALIPR
ncbi:unnamed protein product [Adineta steineri]|uniref:Uncharacterized protein n=1 Tax=Adineta steineri TaxID=433720 RepID=A0A818ZFJ7_9BILA|nr:unnamed protein product [Adineta steineri]CAF3768343.1 unnamed protein product [Adineta steineri]